MSTALCYLHPDCREVPELAAACLRARRPESSRWRESWLINLRTARYLERKALESGLPFEVRPDWFPPTIDWCVFEETILQFEERVLLAAGQFGVPVEITCDEQAYSINAPDLIARWNIKPPHWDKRSHLRVQVRTINPALSRLSGPKAGIMGPAKLRATDLRFLERVKSRCAPLAPASREGGTDG